MPDSVGSEKRAAEEVGWTWTGAVRPSVAPPGSGPGKSRMTLSSDPDHEIILVPPLGQSGREQLLQECYDIRINVFHHEQGYSLNAVFDELRLIGPAAVVAPSVIKGFCLFLRLRAD